MKVIAAKEVRVPMESKPRSYIDDASPIDVPDTAYYRRRIAEGDLLLVTDDAPADSPAKETKKGAK